MKWDGANRERDVMLRVWLVFILVWVRAFFPSLPQLLTIQEIMSVNEAQSCKHVFTFLNVQSLQVQGKCALWHCNR